MFDLARFHTTFRAHAGAESVRNLAQQIGISASTVSRVANGEMVDLESFAAIVQWLGKSPNEFFVLEPVEHKSADEQLLAIGYALYSADLPEELNESILTIVRLVQNARK